MTERISVKASTRYDVIVGRGVMNGADGYIAEAIGEKRHAAMVVSDDVVFPLYGENTVKTLLSCGFHAVETFVFPHGEASKNLAVYGALLEAMCRKGFSRGDIAVALGGGVVGDLAGFAAATYHRGMRFIQIPTTLLACVDSSVGGKTAVDLECGKNAVGAFHQPSLVLCDPDLLATLPEREYACGCAEIIKYAMIGSEAFFDELDETPVRDRYEEVISRCVRMKRDVVEADELDTGVRMTLNLGHTFGHAAEACSGYSIPHGYAVAMGTSVITRAAAAMGLCGRDVSERLDALLKKYGLPTGIPFSSGELEREIAADKKAAGGVVKLIVPERIGKCAITPVTIRSVGEWLKAGGVR